MEALLLGWEECLAYTFAEKCGFLNNTIDLKSRVLIQEVI
jgi:hypothetical protein